MNIRLLMPVPAFLPSANVGNPFRASNPAGMQEQTGKRHPCKGFSAFPAFSTFSYLCFTKTGGGSAVAIRASSMAHGARLSLSSLRGKSVKAPLQERFWQTEKTFFSHQHPTTLKSPCKKKKPGKTSLTTILTR